MELVFDYRGLKIHVDEPERPYFEAAGEGRLTVQSCADCGIVRYPPSHRCVACGSGRCEWHDTSGKGRVSTCLIVEHGVREDFPAPYAIGLVELDDVRAERPEYAVRILSMILEAGDGEATVTDPVPDGTPVEVSFRPLADGYALPVFRLTGQS